MRIMLVAAAVAMISSPALAASSSPMASTPPSTTAKGPIAPAGKAPYGDKAAKACLSPSAFLAMLPSANGVLLAREPVSGPVNAITGIGFRRNDVAAAMFFENGCATALVILGKLEPGLAI